MIQKSGTISVTWRIKHKKGIIEKLNMIKKSNRLHRITFKTERTWLLGRCT